MDPTSLSGWALTQLVLADLRDALIDTGLLLPRSFFRVHTNKCRAYVIALGVHFSTNDLSDQPEFLPPEDVIEKWRSRQ